MFKVHIGYTPTGRNRWRRFFSLEAATTFCNKVFALSGIVLTVTKDAR